MKRLPDRTSRHTPRPEETGLLAFLRMLWAVDHGLHQQSRRMQRTLGITGPQRVVLRLIGRFPGITAGHLASLLHVHPSTLTGVLDRMVRGGWIDRRVDPRDRRRARLGLTAKGRRLDVPAEGTAESAVRAVLAQRSQHELQATRRVLQSLAAAMESKGPTVLAPSTLAAGHRRGSR